MAAASRSSRSGHANVSSAASSSSSYRCTCLPEARSASRSALAACGPATSTCSTVSKVGSCLASRSTRESSTMTTCVLGVVRDVGELLGEQPDVERVQHGAHRRHREVGLEVLGVVPLERADPLVPGDAQPAQGVGEPGRAPARGRRTSGSGAESAVAVITCPSPCTSVPWRRIAPIVSGNSCIVLRMGEPSWTWVVDHLPASCRPRPRAVQDSPKVGPWMTPCCPCPARPGATSRCCTSSATSPPRCPRSTSTWGCTRACPTSRPGPPRSARPDRG